MQQNTPPTKLILALISLLILSYVPGFIFDEPTMIQIVTEDGPYENLGALFFLVASVFFFLSYKNSKSGNDFFFFSLRKNVFYLLLGLLFFFIAGEEISWGQRIFGIETPDAIESSNIQKEMNLHNLKIFNSVDEQNVKRPWYDIFSMSRLFRVFWFLFCIATPFLDKYSAFVKGLRQRLNIPLVPLSIGVLMLVNYLLSKVMERTVSDVIRFVEIEEFNHSLFFAVIAIWLYRTNKGSELVKN